MKANQLNKHDESIKRIKSLFEQFKELTDGNAPAAAILVLAHAANVGRDSGPLEAKPNDVGMLTVQTAADRLNVSPSTVYRLCEEGQLRSLSIGSGRGTKRIRPDDLKRFEQQTVTAEKAKPGRITLEQVLAR